MFVCLSVVVIFVCLFVCCCHFCLFVCCHFCLFVCLFVVIFVCLFVCLLSFLFVFIAVSILCLLDILLFLPPLVPPPSFFHFFFLSFFEDILNIVNSFCFCCDDCKELYINKYLNMKQICPSEVHILNIPVFTIVIGSNVIFLFFYFYCKLFDECTRK